MKRAVVFLLIYFLIVSLTGCDSLQRKFTRKKKEPVKAPRFYQLKKYEKKPTPELYKKHYAYWVSWQSELIEVAGENSKKDKRCIEEIIGNLYDMQNILVKEKGDELTPHIERLLRVKDIIFRGDLNRANRDYVISTLQHEDRVIKSNFNYSKVKDYLKKSFDEPVPEAPVKVAESVKEEDSGLAPYSVVIKKEEPAPEKESSGAAEPQSAR